jgi:hypothetical protein
MAKGNSSKVIPAIAEKAIESGKSLQALYSECVMVSYRATGRLSCGFDAKDLVAWIRENHPDLFDEKGRRIQSDI